MWLTVKDGKNKQTIEITGTIIGTIIGTLGIINIERFWEDYYTEKCMENNPNQNFEEMDVDFVSITDEKPEEGSPIEDYIRKQIPVIEKAIELTTEYQQQQNQGKLWFAKKCLEYCNKFRPAIIYSETRGIR